MRGLLALLLAASAPAGAGDPGTLGARGAAPVQAAGRAAWLEEGGLLYRRGQLSRAAEHFERAAEEGAGAEAWLNAAVVRRDLAQDEASLAAFEKAAALRPKDPAVQTELGWAALRAVSGGSGSLLGAPAHDPLGGAGAWALAQGQAAPLDRGLAGVGPGRGRGAHVTDDDQLFAVGQLAYSDGSHDTLPLDPMLSQGE